LGEIKERFCTISRGQKIAYVVDARYDEENEVKIVALVQGSDLFYCESPYLDVDAGRPRSLSPDRETSRTHGTQGPSARPRFVFHFSPRYTGQGEALEREAMEAFQGI